MSTPKRERSRDNVKKTSKSASKINSDYKLKFSNSNSKNESNNSSNSDSFGFQKGSSDKNIVSINFEKISDFSEFTKKINLIESPCTIENIDFLKLNQNQKNSVDFPIDIFNNVSPRNIIPLNKVSIQKDFFNKSYNNKIIFSSLLFKQNNIEKKDKKLFNKIHNYLTAFHLESKISDFCFNKELYFKYSFNDIFYEIQRYYTESFRAHHYHLEFGKINYHFGVKGCGKSISSRAIIHNYMHFKLISGKDVFIPTMFFDLKVLNKFLGKKEEFFNIIKYELMGLFRDYEKWKKFVFFIQDKIQSFSVFECIIEILNYFYEKNNINKLLIVIDHYSEYYDNFNDLNIVKEKCLKDKNFDIYIIYDIKTINDQRNFLEFFKNEIFLCPLPKGKKILDLDSSEMACYHQYELKNFLEIKKYLFKEKIPEQYEEYFSQNVSYYFKYKSQYSDKNFNEFIEIEKENIKEDLRDFYKNCNIHLFLIISKIIGYISKPVFKKEIKFNFDFFQYIPCSYFLFYKENEKYSFEPAFPLVKICLEEMFINLNNNFFIDIKSDQFLRLDGATMGIFFDRFMNNWLENKIKTKLFQFSNEEIESFHLKYLIKKNNKNCSISEMFHNDFVIKEIEKDKELKEINHFYKNNKIQNKKCIIIFQDFNGKSIDILFIVKRNGEEEYTINCFQIKCSKEFKIDEKLYQQNRFEMTYLKNKFQNLLNLKINEAYLTYISIKEIPKLCAIQNKEKFIYYSIQSDLLVDNENNEIAEIPFYEDCKIYLIEEDDILKFIRTYIQFLYNKLIFKIVISNENEILYDKLQIENSVIININKKKINVKFNLLGFEYIIEKFNENNIEEKISYYKIVINESDGL